MTLLKKNDPRRKWRSFKRHAVLLLWTFTLASNITAVWYELWIRGYYLPEDDKELIFCFVGALGVVYGVFMSLTAMAASGKYDTVISTIFDRSKRKYLRYRDERPPIAMHLTIALLSIPFDGMFCFLPYRHMQTGVSCVFTMSVVVIAFWFLIAILEQPTKSAWVDERTPKDWKDADVDDFFEFGKENDGRKVIRGFSERDQER